MALTITLTTELEQKLDALAAANGQNTADYALSLLNKQISNGHQANGSTPHADAQNENHSDTGTSTTDAAEEASDALARAIATITNRTPEQIAQIQARALMLYKPERPLPPGKTFAETVAGKWPGDETDEQIQAALDELS